MTATWVIGAGAVAVAVVAPLVVLVGLASFGFLVLFCLVNVVAFRRKTQHRAIAAFGALGSAGGVVILIAYYLS